MTPTLVLTPGMRGEDGLSLLSREVVSALEWIPGAPGVEVWSLTDRRGNGSQAHRSAGGNRLLYGVWGLRHGLIPQRGRLVLTLHAHLLPVALPLVRRGARLVYFVVGIDSWKPLSRLQTAALRRAWRVAAISQHAATEFLRVNSWFPDSALPICHPGLPDTGDGGAPGTGGYALMVGRMSREERYKGHDLLLDIWGELRSRISGAELLVAGEGDDRLRLQGKAKRLGLENSVRFLGKVSSDDLDRLYRECAFYVMPSRREGFGLVFLEAMRAGKAAIGARGAASEIIEDGVTGYVVDAEDRGAILSAIERLWNDPAVRDRMGSNGRRRFLERFTRERFRERLRGVLSD